MWRALANRILELGWIDRNSTLEPGLFGLAKSHPGMTIWFTIDWLKYADKIMEEAKQQNLDIDNKPLVAYKCSVEEYENNFKEKELADIKEYSDYASVYSQVRKEITEDGE